MWWGGKKVANVYLGESHVALSHQTDEGTQGQRMVVEHRDVAGRAEAIACLSTWCAALLPRTDVQVWFSCGVCRPFLMEDLADLRSDAERRRAAAALARQRLSFSGPVEIWLEGPPANATSRVVVAADAHWIADVVAVCAKAGRRLASLRPWWTSVLDSALADTAQPNAIGIVDSDGLTVLAGQGDSFDLIEVICPLTDLDVARSNLSRSLIDFDTPLSKTRLYALDWTARADEAMSCQFGDWARRLA